MKSSIILSSLSLLIAVASLVVSLRKSQAAVTDADIDQRVEIALSRKERFYVEAMAPKMNLIYKDMLRDYKPSATPPQTFAELFLPALRIFSQLGSQ